MTPPKVKDVSACDGCPMRRLFPDNTFVAPVIKEGGRLVIAEAPGEQEAILGEPLVGSSGAWLRGRPNDRGEMSGGLLGRAGIRDSEVSRINCIQCRPPNNLFPTDPDARTYISSEDADAAVHHCFDNHVLPVLVGRDWKRIDLLGDKALRIVGQKVEGIQTWRGSPLSIPALGDRLVAVPTLHPAAIARDQRFIPAVVSDLKKNLVVPPEYYNLHPTLQEVREFTADTFAFDIETDMTTGRITCVGLCAKPFYAMCVPFQGAYYDELKRIFNGATEVIGHNCLQFDLPRLRDAGIGCRESVFTWDTMLCQHLLQPDLPHDLGFLGSIFTNKPAWKHLSGDDPELYNCRDTDVTLQCWLQLRPLLKAQNLQALYETVSVPLARICYQMHQTGICVDPKRVETVRERLIEEMRTAELALPEALRRHDVPIKKRELAPAGTLSAKTGKPLKYVMVDAVEEVVPWRSGDSLRQWLYKDLGLPEQLHAKTAEVTVDKTAIEKLTHQLERGRIRRDDAQQLVRQLKALADLRKRATLIQGFCTEQMLTAQRVHPHFNVHGTASGRLSSSEPNLQNIPEAARYLYVPSSSDWSFLEADYHGLENCLTAWFARDTARLVKLADPKYNEHKAVASAFFDIPYDEVVKDNDKDAPYGKAKRINHGCNYGMGPRKICNMYDMDFAEVRRLVAKWREVNAKTVVWQEATAARAKADGYLITPFGRKRWFYTDSYFTESLSFLPQSTGADIVFRAMLALRDRLPNGVRLLLQVHDSLLFEGPAQAIDEAKPIIREVMEQPWPELDNFRIPVDFKSGLPGQSWGELE